MQRIFFVLLLTIVMVSGQSQTLLNVTKTDNSVTQFQLLTSEVTFSPTGDVQVKQGTNAIVSFAFSSIKEITFGNSVTTEIEKLSVNNIKFTCTNNQLNLIVPKENSINSVAIFNSVGQTVLSINQPVETTFNISNLESGVYFLKINNRQTFKFIKK